MKNKIRFSKGFYLWLALLIAVRGSNLRGWKRWIKLDHVIFATHIWTSLSSIQTEILEKYGFPTETHEFTTEDGYLLTLFRVPHGKNGTGVNPKPILMMHGLFGSSENFVVAEMFGSSMAGYFANRGYDVWLGNARGSLHCRKHVTLDPDKSKFWNFR